MRESKNSALCWSGLHPILLSGNCQKCNNIANCQIPQGTFELSQAKWTAPIR